MNNRFLRGIFLILLLSNAEPAFGRKVMSWIPVYGIDNCKSLLNDSASSAWFKNGLTHIGLQFWVPGDHGAVVFVTDYQYTSKSATIGQDVKDFVSWGTANNVKVMLCLHNIRASDFDWTYTQKVINDYPKQTVSSIMAIVSANSLAGVDIDFEGIGDFNSDKAAFVRFLDTLGTALHAAGKELSVDMFSTPCYNSPNPSWESAMAPHVDFINIMGYNDTYKSNNTLFQYCPNTPSESNVYAFQYSYIENYLTKKQGVASSKLAYGLPGWLETWGGKCVHENLMDIMDVSTGGGIAIWDLGLSEGYWKNPVTWEIIAEFKNNKSSTQIRNMYLICGVKTDLTEYAEPTPVYYNSSTQVVHFSGTQGELYLFSTLGILEKSWTVPQGEDISLVGQTSGAYILKYKTGKNVYSMRALVVN